MQLNARSSSNSKTALRQTLRALRGRNYALFFFGQGLSLIGTWMQSVAIGMLVWKLTHDEEWLGRVGFFSQIFGFVLAPVAGVLSDRLHRHRMVVVTQALAMLQAGMLAGLTLTGQIHIWHVVALATFLGLVNAVDVPTRQAFVVQMVDRREDLPNAIALNSMIFNLARLVGPLAAGAIIPLVGRRVEFPYAGEGFCFAVNAASYLAVLAALLAMRLPPWQRPAATINPLQSLAEGFRYTASSPIIRSTLILLAIVSLVAVPYSVLLPAVAAKQLHAGRPQITLVCLGEHCLRLNLENTFGLLVSSAGTGAVLGAVYMASRQKVHGLPRLIAVGRVLLGLGLVAFSLATVVWLSVLLLVLIGFGFMVHMVSCNTIIQTVVDDDKRGRVMSLYMMAFLGTAPIGALLAGWLAGRIGAPRTILLGGGICLALSVGLAVNRWRGGRRQRGPLANRGMGD